MADKTQDEKIPTGFHRRHSRHADDGAMIEFVSRHCPVIPVILPDATTTPSYPSFCQACSG